MSNFKQGINQLLFLMLLCNIFSCQQAPSNLSLPALFSNHLVLQQNTNSAIWGNATPKTVISIKGSWGENQQAITDTTGKWQTNLKTPAAGGPYELTISAADTTLSLIHI